ncbi:MAG TPA: hypothetical protein VI336_03950 [Candidatus Saccharimonadales bacterium]|nr:hypothetical protein [Candidatus Saccharimonadales bacterium]
MTKLGHEQPHFDNNGDMTLFSGDSYTELPPKPEPSPFQPPEVKTPSDEEIDLIERYSDQMTPLQVAGKRGVNYTPSSPPDAARQPEKGRHIKIDRRRLGSRQKMTADTPPQAIEEEMRRIRGY